MAKFVITKRVNGQFQFALMSDNDEILLTSESYTTKQGCENGIASVRTNGQNDNNYDCKNTLGGKTYFNLRGANMQIIGISQMYERDEDRDKGIAFVKSYAPDATIEEEVL
jgi:uncharacterized protein